MVILSCKTEEKCFCNLHGKITQEKIKHLAYFLAFLERVYVLLRKRIIFAFGLLASSQACVCIRLQEKLPEKTAIIFLRTK